ncbi:rhodanese-related sulfurtransferase [Texas Phoenix palm phytoplasma]|uniref:tRNA uridine(34) hydroxylase n=1 Tax=Texas Phoenix palm phytoplasma TaxID=176709 RepID=A0ABS5BIR0_9MOLU|nr:rhodanese-related sulfurtransferase [Texas Phoenix palm phytoplasma]MBP3059462.1 rhodanese-related sulfurtransferase [Texas Phoenix palm phytoplasma]
MFKNETYLIILYYKYFFIDEPEKFKNEQFDYCNKLGLLGRIIVSKEGINGTLSGSEKNINKYIKYMKKSDFGYDIDFKKDFFHKHVFSKLSVKVRDEIVSLKLQEDIFPYKDKQYYLKPKEFFNILNQNDVFVLDVRNNYEYNLGHFRNAINPDIENFRFLPNWIEENLHLMKNKKVLTYCTGGVRCEKISCFLKKKGIDEVYQLEGGIIKYSQDKELKGELFDGKMYVFDERISTEVNKQKHIIIGKDFFDQTPCERYINCANPKCNKQILCSEENEDYFLGSCSKECRKDENNIYKTRKKRNI